MFDLKGPYGDREKFESGYTGNIDQSILLSDSEDILYKCMCFEIRDMIYWQRLILTNKKIIRLWRNKVYYIYLKSIETITLTCVNESNVDDYDDMLARCVDRGDTPYYVSLDGYKILLNNEDDAMTLVDEINRLICD